MSRQFWQELLAWATSDGTAVANTTTETIIFPNVTVPANYMQDGRVLRLEAFGRLSTTGTPTVTYAASASRTGRVMRTTSVRMATNSGLTPVPVR